MKATSRRKTKRRRAVKLPRRNAPQQARQTGASVADLKKTNALLTRELTEAREQQKATSRELSESLERETATSQVLGIISSSPSDLQSVFQTILANATRLCEAGFGILYRYDGNVFHAEAMRDVSPEFAQWLRQEPNRADPRNALGRMLGTKQPVHIADVTAEPAYAEREPTRIALVEVGKARTFLAIPMLKEGELLGAICIYRHEVRPFTDKQIALVTNFANQAVIAIENARVLNELRDRTTELSKSLEQQTATSEVLGVISSSPGELEPVFQAMLANATRLCEANFGMLYRYDGQVLRAEAVRGVPAAFAKFLKGHRLPADPRNAFGRLVQTKQAVHIADVMAEPAYAEREPSRVASVELARARTFVLVPMLQE